MLVGSVAYHHYGKNRDEELKKRIDVSNPLQAGEEYAKVCLKNNERFILSVYTEIAVDNMSSTDWITPGVDAGQIQQYQLEHLPVMATYMHEKSAIAEKALRFAHGFNSIILKALSNSDQ